MYCTTPFIFKAYFNWVKTHRGLLERIDQNIIATHGSTGVNPDFHVSIVGEDKFSMNLGTPGPQSKVPSHLRGSPFLHLYRRSEMVLSSPRFSMKFDGLLLIQQHFLYLTALGDQCLDRFLSLICYFHASY